MGATSLAVKEEAYQEQIAEEFEGKTESIGGVFVDAQNRAICGTLLAAVVCLVAYTFIV